ncbi:MAG: hypothetical protein J5J00_00060 [Deltaproteobacteria bacterium]|nr:hypothetical protein [Deltaproteobacteria bacterium]
MELSLKQREQLRPHPADADPIRSEPLPRQSRPPASLGELSQKQREQLSGILVDLRNEQLASRYPKEDPRASAIRTGCIWSSAEEISRIKDPIRRFNALSSVHDAYLGSGRSDGEEFKGEAVNGAVQKLGSPIEFEALLVSCGINPRIYTSDISGHCARLTEALNWLESIYSERPSGAVSGKLQVASHQ